MLRLKYNIFNRDVIGKFLPVARKRFKTTIPVTKFQKEEYYQLKVNINLIMDHTSLKYTEKQTVLDEFITKESANIDSYVCGNYCYKIF